MLVADGVSPARLSAEPALSKPRQLVGFSASSSSAVGCSARPRQLGVSRTPVLVTSVTASVLLRAASRRSQRALRCRRGGDSNVLRCAYGNNSLSRFSPLTDPSSWALVTGATTGLGQALARACLSAGYSVVLTERSDDRALQDLATKLRSEAGVQSDDLRLSSSDLRWFKIARFD
ncbi:unnamed protein product [Polarella glacialis]|uniref:Uncharacterized protein n=1 Tax=Polarella glacialis TaxID=89957 RepID=A0A813LYX2_POLGL|nr:unnamed protein product [Polarella glacialis]